MIPTYLLFLSISEIHSAWPKRFTKINLGANKPYDPYTLDGISPGNWSFWLQKVVFKVPWYFQSLIILCNLEIILHDVYDE